jgi:hypothetical protein
MLKPLTLSLSLAVALGACSLGMAGHHNTFASGQCETPSAQALPSAQGCGTPCGTSRKHCLSNLFKHKPKCYTYEWVLKKKRVWGHGGGCGGNACGSCGDAIYPTGQSLGSPQGALGSGQAWGAGQGGGSGQAAGAVEAPPPAPASDTTAPPAPATPPTASNGGLLFLSPAGN